MKQLFFVGFVSFMVGLFGTVSSAEAQLMCGKRGDVVKYLEKGYDEEPVSIGLAESGSVVEVFASEAGSFTIIVTRTDGVSCLLTAGNNWETMQLQKAGAKI